MGGSADRSLALLRNGLQSLVVDEVDVLVVDDEQDILRMLRTTFEAHGLKVACCDGPFGVAAAIRKHTPTVVVLDLMMPALGGAAIATRLAPLGLEAGRIIFYSATDEDELRAVALSVEGSSYVHKARGIAALEEAIRSVMVRYDSASGR